MKWPFSVDFLFFQEFLLKRSWFIHSLWKSNDQNVAQWTQLEIEELFVKFNFCRIPDVSFLKNRCSFDQIQAFLCPVSNRMISLFQTKTWAQKVKLMCTQLNFDWVTRRNKRVPMERKIDFDKTYCHNLNRIRQVFKDQCSGRAYTNFCLIFSGLKWAKSPMCN